MEEGGVEAVSDQCVVTVALEVVLLAVKRDVVRISPDLAVTRACTDYVQRKKAMKHTYLKSSIALQSF